MPFQHLIYRREDAICHLTLNRPEKLNALNAVLMSELREAFETIEADPEIRVVILTGAGRAFSAGFDIERGSGQADPSQTPADVWRDHLQSHIDTFLMVWNLSKPVIAAVNGYALAGACELVQVVSQNVADAIAMTPAAAGNRPIQNVVIQGIDVRKGN